MAAGKDSRTKVVLARKIGKQGLGGTPGSNEKGEKQLLVVFKNMDLRYKGPGAIIAAIFAMALACEPKKQSK